MAKNDIVFAIEHRDRPGACFSPGQRGPRLWGEPKQHWLLFARAKDAARFGQYLLPPVPYPCKHRIVEVDLAEVETAEAGLADGGDG